LIGRAVKGELTKGYLDGLFLRRKSFSHDRVGGRYGLDFKKFWKASLLQASRKAWMRASRFMLGPGAPMGWFKASSTFIL
jgi:hypothetical protein